MTAVVNSAPDISDRELAKLYRAAENLVATKRAEDARIAELIECARAKPRSWLSEELGYGLSNLGKFLTGKIKPSKVLNRLTELRILKEG